MVILMQELETALKRRGHFRWHSSIKKMQKRLPFSIGKIFGSCHSVCRYKINYLNAVDSSCTDNDCLGICRAEHHIYLKAKL